VDCEGETEHAGPVNRSTMRIGTPQAPPEGIQSVKNLKWRQAMLKRQLGKSGLDTGEGGGRAKI